MSADFASTSACRSLLLPYKFCMPASMLALSLGSLPANSLPQPSMQDSTRPSAAFTSTSVGLGGSDSRPWSLHRSKHLRRVAAE